MSLEQTLASLVAAIEANTAAIKAATRPAGAASPATPEVRPEVTAKPAAAATPAKPEKPVKAEPKGYQAKHTKEEMQAAISSVKDATDVATARAVMASAGYVGKVSELSDPETIDKVYAAAAAKMEELDNEP